MATEAALAVAAEYKERQERVRAATTRRILAVYAALEAARAVPSWRAGIGDAIFALISAAQEQAAVEAESYIRRAAAAQGITIEGPRVNPRRFAAIASDNRPLDTLLVSAPLKVAQGVRAGKTPAQAKHAGEMSIRRIIETQVPDAARAANSVVIATARSTQQPGLRAGRGSPDARARAERIRRALDTTTLSPEREADIERRLKARAAQDAAKAARELQDEPIVPTGNPKGVSLGYVRMLTPPSCDRCVILAGRWYRWNKGFERHPMCDCVHIPAAESKAQDITVDPMEYFDSLSEADQNKYFGKANSLAIREGADITQVVNQNRTKGSMFTADDGRRYTNEGLTRRSLPQHARKQRGLDPMVLRPTVWQIYRDSAGNREAATQALRDFGYIL